MSSHYHYLLLILSITLSFILICAENDGFSVQLIHRDSPNSILFNPNETDFQRSINSLHRSINRYNNSLLYVPQPIITNPEGEYLMKYSLGTPPVEVIGLLDTASDLIWLQCEPCINCYHQSSPIFEPLDSKTFEDILCPSTQCRQVLGDTKCKSANCEYGITYDNDAYSKGFLAQDTITLRTSGGSSVQYPKIFVGCGNDNKGPSGFSGVIGMGFGLTSLISQISASVDDKFAYCLTLDHSTTSKLNFGVNAIVSGSGVTTTPLAYGPAPTFYYVNLEGVTIGSGRMSYTKEDEKSTTFEGNNNGALKGNMIIDTGTTLTYIFKRIFDEIQSTLLLLIKLQPVTDPLNLGRICYNNPSLVLQRTPYITLHFTGNADVTLHETNVFVPMYNNMVCFAFASTVADTGTLGNAAQTNFVVGIDRKSRTVSFQQTDCTKY